MNTEIKSKGNAGGIPVYCSFDKIVEIGEVKPNPRIPIRRIRLRCWRRLSRHKDGEHR